MRLMYCKTFNKYLYFYILIRKEHIVIHMFKRRLILHWGKDFKYNP